MRYALILLIALLVIVPNTFSQPSFKEQVLDTNVAIGYGLAIGDVNGDNKPDILLADKKQFVWYRNGDWKRFVLVDNLTTSDNVCIAARDIDGDGKVEIAVGAQWNPGETADTTKSGSVHYLIRPSDPTKLWTTVELHHEPTIHRMRWVKVSSKNYQLVVLPLHGRGNKDGQGKGVKVFAYEKPVDPKSTWKLRLIDSTMHMTHNMDLVVNGDRENIYIGGKEGVRLCTYDGVKWTAQKQMFINDNGYGEVRLGGSRSGAALMAAIQPMHGTNLCVYNTAKKRSVLTTGMNQGHALAMTNIYEEGSLSMQVIAGWREPDADKKVGIKVFIPDNTYENWTAYWVDDNGMACEDLQVADLDGDGKKEIIASGRSTRNLKIYWNKN